MPTAVALLTRDLRVRDNPVLAAAARAGETVVPLFVIDPRLVDLSPNRHQFLIECLADLRESLRGRGGDLVIRQGDPVVEALRLARDTNASAIAVATDVSHYARDRERRLAAGCAELRVPLKLLPGTTIVAPGDVRPGGGGPSYRVFTPYWRSWRQHEWRGPAPTPRRLALPDGVPPGRLPAPPGRERSPNPARGGETEARRLLKGWLGAVGGYEHNHDLMAIDRTSRLSPYLRFGCLSALEVARAVLDQGGPAAEAYVRQLCWRDFYYQVTAAFPAITNRPVRDVAEEWRHDEEHLAAWRAGHTGIPIVDAGMRQLVAEGWMHNRARLLVGSYLTKHLGLDWRDGARHFERFLLDGDVPNNYGNWQWVAGTGNDSKPYRRFNPIRQAQRFDPDGDYVRRYVPELSDVDGSAVHEPWKLPAGVRGGYPSPLSGPRTESWLPV